MSFVEVLPVEPVMPTIGARAVAHGAPDRGHGGEVVVRDERRGGAGACAPRRGSRHRRGPRQRDRLSDPAESIWTPVTSSAVDARADRALELSNRSGITPELPAAEAPPGDLAVVERQLAVGELLPLFVALAGDDDDVSLAREADRLAIAARRSGSTFGSGPMPARISSMIARGSSLRGLSEVTIGTSESSAAIRPISGRLPRSRSPPQPKTQMSRPVVSSRAVRRTFASESGVCA